jgi:beta-N-acetylhexosaminidase
MAIANLMIDVDGLMLQAEEKEILQHPYIDGIILFTRNYESPKQVRELITSIRKCKKTPLSIAVDQEGGRVQRFKDPLTTLPPASYFGELYSESPELAQIKAEEIGYQMAAELRELGVDFSFAPVLDLDWKNSTIIGNRAFHSDPEIVSYLAGAFVRGMSRANMPSVGKHFPGHGWVKADSHHEIPIDTRDWETLWNYDLKPFKTLISQGLDAIMPAHVIYSECDPHPAGFSKFWLQKILRQKLNFEGTIYSDDLSMVGASVVGDIIERVKTALTAGCDKLLICNDRSSVIKVLDASLGSSHK